ncbi:MAG: amidohydrolase [Thermorudis peleae]|nr:amidohydrolase [Thermorudis peleae]
MAADLVLYNGQILTGHLGPAAHPTAVAILHGRIVAVGDDDTVRPWIGRHTEVLNLNGRTVTPGFNDAHCHPMAVGHALSEVDARTPPLRTIDELVARIAERARSTPPGTWIIARGYDQARLAEGRHPSRTDLDRATTQHPVLLVRACGHIGVVNSQGLALAGITATTPDPPGGTIDRDVHGEPTGVVREAALEAVRRCIPEPTVEQIEEALISAGRLFLSHGVTSVAEAGIGNAREFTAYQHLAQSGQLPVRTTLMVRINDLFEPFAELGLRSGFGDHWLRIGPMKLFLDGSIGGRTARMSEPYLGTEDHYGLWTEDPAVLKQKIIRAHLAGYQCCAHAIGDAAIELLLDAYDEALALAPRPNHRHRIEHCSILRPDLLDRIARLNAIPIPGTTFLYDFQEAYTAALPRERLRYTYAMRTFFDRGIIAAASTDAPVCSTSALLGIQTMVTRQNAKGATLWPEECITVLEAVRAYTYNGAYATFEEHIKGTIEPGKLADLTILETDLLRVAPTDIAAIKVDYTIIEGRVAYERPGAA